MNELQLLSLLPFMVLAAASVVVILLIAFKAGHTVIQVTGFIMMCLVVLAMWYVKDTLPMLVPPLFIVDGQAALFTGLIICCVLVVGLLSYIYFEEREENPKEYYILLFLATLGGAILTISQHFISLFIGLELLSVSLYGLIAYLRTRNHAVEAGMKYLVLAAMSSAFLLFGMALIYMETGSMTFAGLSAKMAGQTGTPVFLLGMGMMIVAIGFKMALVPFHLWVADVYQGAPSPVTAFIATSSKIGTFAVLLRFAHSVDLQQYPLMITVFSVLAIASMVSGNILALRQNNLKRLLAYSSIAHFGYLLVAFLPGTEAGTEATIFYLVAYAVTLLAAFGVIVLLSNGEDEADQLEGYKGLIWRRPVLGAVLTIALFSLAGIPLTAGFLAKFMVLSAGVERSLWPLLIVLVLTSVIGLYYYLRVISTLFARPEPAIQTPGPRHPFFYFSTYAALIIMVGALCWLGVFPGLILQGIRSFLLLH
ncbi:NADH-quinone oxidoreductase subunit N [Chitinophaga agri]|uniref:NADH-quinone oxidoreductase subunit N n=1 Tax=Chitinophaga agri TaxID=2703787 RepID=A0A6B9ZBL5_9BACT|nr:NADH-quinone oxidoreductase subunit N [Chitinophaga agri]QHS58881.1 NADH-quinone oxidoreductase subunit N [Chitinophaga agri]